MRKAFFLLVAVLVLGVPSLVLQGPPSATLAASVNGEALYLVNCSGCHGASGLGAVNIAPPLAKNRTVTGAATVAIDAALGGLAGPVTEGGKTWNGSMPSWQGTLSNEQLAAIISYIRGAWGNGAPPVTTRQVAARARIIAASASSAPASPTQVARVNGEAVYLENCSGCHGASGQGAPNIAPPLAKNAYVTGNPTAVIHAVTGGLAGPVLEHGATWNGSMPPWRGTLSDAQLAAVISYIRGAWGNSAKPVTAAQISATK